MITRNIEEFLVFAEKLNWSAAAKELFITRGTLREHMVQLEKELGVTLIEKKESGLLALTPIGEQFLVDGRFLLDSVAKVVDKYSNLKDTALTLRIGSVDFVWLEPYIYLARERYLNENPGKTVEFISVDRGTVEESFAEDIVDIAAVSLKTWRDDVASMNNMAFPNTQAIPLSEEETYLLVPSTHRFYQMNELHAFDFDGDTIVLPKNIADWWNRDGVAEAVESAGGIINIAGRSFKNLSTYFAFAFGNQLGGVSCTQISRVGVEFRSDFRIMRMSDLPLVSKFFAVYKNQLSTNENARRFMECLRRVAEDKSQECQGYQSPVVIGD